MSGVVARRVENVLPRLVNSVVASNSRGAAGAADGMVPKRIHHSLACGRPGAGGAENGAEDRSAQPPPEKYSKLLPIELETKLCDREDEKPRTCSLPGHG